MLSGLVEGHKLYRGRVLGRVGELAIGSHRIKVVSSNGHQGPLARNIMVKLVLQVNEALVSSKKEEKGF